MAEKSKITRRESALVSILERMADQLQKQDSLLDDVVNRQLEFSKTLERTEFGHRSRQIEYEEAITKVQESFSRYRSDMLSLVNEQDHINENMAEYNALMNKTAYALEGSNQNIAALERKVEAQERSIREHIEHSYKQEELFHKELADTNRYFAKLHMDTEKYLGKMHLETQKQLEKVQQETTRRLMVLGEMESALQTLLIRTEPPEKKPFWFTRLFRRAFGFCRTRLSRFLNWVQH